ncbi:hypothetical protein R1flu_021363 [Riccia fluitans]|uniref:Uncharacterized protein n=1 Tax=Riccia fluitans TaxID=41844 RepID=A0ABD1ZP49_9MARC
MIDLSDESQEAKQEEETILAEDTSQAPKGDTIEKFRLSMKFDAKVVTPILHILEESRALVEGETERQMILPAITLHLSKENRIKEMKKLRKEAQKATSDKL